MGLKLRGESWYLRKMVGGERKEVPLGVYGGEANRKKAERAAKAMGEQMTESHAGLRLMSKMGIATPKPKAEAPTLAEWWATYLVNYTSEKADRTQDRDQSIMEVYLPMQIDGTTVGEMKLDQFRQADCLTMLRQRRAMKARNPGRRNPKVVSEGTVQRDRRLLQAVFERAVENDHITKNPWKGVEAKPDATRIDRILTEEDEPKLIAAMRMLVQDACGRLVRMDERYVRFVGFLLETGLRIDELLNKHFRDLNDRVHVRGKGSKERDVALTSKARRILDEQWADTERPKADKGHPWWQNEQRFREVMRKACKRAGIAHLSPHDLRHTFGHRYLVRGGDIYVLSKVLGHASIAVTERHYGYLSHADVGKKMLAVMEPVAPVKPAKPARRLVAVK